MFCKNCGTKSDGVKKFCTNCGREFLHASKAPQDSEAAFIKKASKSSWNASQIIGVIIVILLIGWGAYSSQDEDVIEKNNNAISNYDAGNSQDAISGFQEASKNAISTDNKIATLVNLAYAYSGDNKNDEALNSFQEALKLTSKESFDYYLISGEIAVLEGKPNSAYLSYKKAYQLNPNSFQINNALALFEMDLDEQHPEFEDYKSALVHAQKAHDLSKLEIGRQNLAIAHYFNENYDQTISLLSTSNFASHPYAAYWLGLAYLQKKDSVNAKIYFQKAITAGAELPEEINDYMTNN